MNKQILFLIVLLSCFYYVDAQRFTTDTVYVWAENGLNMRSESSVDSKKIANIPFGTKVCIAKYSDEQFGVPDAFGYIHGSWVVVEYNNHKGFVFSGYLHTEPTPEKGEDDLTYLKRIYGPVQTETTYIKNKEGDKITTILLGEGVSITTDIKNEKYAIPTIFIPHISHHQAFTMSKFLYATPQYYNDRKPTIEIDRTAKVITIKEKDQDVGCFFRIQLLEGATGWKRGAVISSYCGC